MTKDQERAIIDFVKRYRNKRFCTCRGIKHELKLDASRRTINRFLNAHGVDWKRAPKFQQPSKDQLEKRKAWVDTYISRTPTWWEEPLHMVLDGVTLTMAPKPLNPREKHAAQRTTSSRKQCKQNNADAA